MIFFFNLFIKHKSSRNLRLLSMFYLETPPPQARVHLETHGNMTKQLHCYIISYHAKNWRHLIQPFLLLILFLFKLWATKIFSSRKLLRYVQNQVFREPSILPFLDRLKFNYLTNAAFIKFSNVFWRARTNLRHHFPTSPKNWNMRYCMRMHDARYQRFSEICSNGKIKDSQTTPFYSLTTNFIDAEGKLFILQYLNIYKL